MPPDEEEKKFCPCAVCLALTPTSVNAAHFRVDFPLVTGTLRLHLCAEHDAYAQKVVQFLYAVPPVPETDVEPVEDEGEEEDDEPDRDTLPTGTDQVGGVPQVPHRPAAPVPLHRRHSHNDRA